MTLPINVRRLITAGEEMRDLLAAIEFDSAGFEDECCNARIEWSEALGALRDDDNNAGGE